MSPLAVLCLVLIVPLAIYAAGLYTAAAVFLVGRLRRRRRAPAPASDAAPRAVSVLVPARNEGVMALRAIQSLLDQDTPAPVAVHLLVRDRDDTSWPHLLAAFPGARDGGDGDVAELLAAGPEAGFAGPRRVSVAFTGVDGKADKINWVVQHLDTPLTAILDCDHQAHPDWLRSAAARLAETGAPVVQGRRAGLAADGLFALWDSLHQHVGCEVFNAAFGEHGLSVFLTGTTFVIETPLLARHPLRSRCITEDIDLSYTLFMEGVRAVADPRGGSDEEVSPDLYSFIARRRRWANGHTDAFLRHLPLLRRAPLRLRDRLQFWFHGLHYLMAAGVLALHAVIGAVFAANLPLGATLAAVAVGVGVAVAVARTQHTRGLATRASEAAVLAAWFTPAALMAANVVLGGLLGDPAASIALPLPDVGLAVGLVAVLAPLAVLLVGLLGFGMLTGSTALVVVASYPVAFYLDLSGVLVGLADFVAGRSTWQAVARAARIARGPRRGRGGGAMGEALAASATAMRALVGHGPPSGLALAADGGAAEVVRASPGARAAATGVPDGDGDGGRGAGVTGVALTPVVSIPETWRLRAIAALVGRTVRMALPKKKAPVRALVWLGVVGLFVGGFAASRATRLDVAPAACKALGFDDYPWVVPARRIPGFCETPGAEGRWSRPRGAFETTRDDALAPLDGDHWDRLQSTFPCNLAEFRPENVVAMDGGGVALELTPKPGATLGGRPSNLDKLYFSGSIATKPESAAAYRLGRFEVEMKAARGSGLLTGFFLHRLSPWQEIDTEFMGRDTTKMLVNVYYNPGEDGALYNYGFYGTPVLVDLGFDAADGFHTYAMEWDVDEIRWYADGRLIHRRRAGRPTPIPHLPMRLYLNLWPNCSEKLVGPVTSDLPARTEIRRVTTSRWTRSTLAPLWSWYDGLLGDGPDGEDGDRPQWQDNADWLQRRAVP